MIREEKNNLLSVYWDSLQELMKYDGMSSYNREAFHRSQREGRGMDWWGFAGTAQSVDNALEHGWPGGLGEIERMTRELDDEFPVKTRDRKFRRKRARGPTGDHLDIHRVNQGQLDRAWTRAVRVRTTAHQSKHVTVVINLSTSAMTKSHATMWRTAVATLVCDYLLRQGKAVRILVADVGTNAYQHCASRYSCNVVKVKDYNEPLTVDKCAVMSSVGFFRRHGFKAIANHPTYMVSSHFGGPADMSLERMPHCLQDEHAAIGTHFIFINRALSLQGAREEYAKVKQQFKGDDDA